MVEDVLVGVYAYLFIHSFLLTLTYLLRVYMGMVYLVRPALLSNKTGDSVVSQSDSTIPRVRIDGVLCVS
jgi:hypothetical protein